MMSATENLEEIVLALPRSERARLAERLIASLDEDSAVEEAWIEEVERRLEAYRKGCLESVSAESAVREARHKIKGNL
ncbi:MAG: addiction module protein [Rhodothermales bacterium]